MGKIMMFCGMLLVAGALAARMADRTASGPVDAQANSARSAQTSVQVSTQSSAQASRSASIARGEGGHFWTDARIDGRHLSLIVDTGASHIALRASDAARVGIHPVARDFTVKVATANGITRAAQVQLRSVEVGNVVVRDLPALVHEDEGLGVNLLGMSFLSRLRWTHERGRLVLEQ
jgi:aspartyl protease family protein